MKFLFCLCLVAFMLIGCEVVVEPEPLPEPLPDDVLRMIECYKDARTVVNKGYYYNVKYEEEAITGIAHIAVTLYNDRYGQ